MSSIHIDDLIKSNNIVVFTDSTSLEQFKKIKQILRYYKIENLVVFKLDKNLNYSENRDYVIKISGSSILPAVYIGGFFIGGLSELETLESTGNLTILLNSLKRSNNNGNKNKKSPVYSKRMTVKVPKSQIPTEKQLLPGTRVFAKVKGNPYWPARIELLPDEVSSKTRYKVIFYGTKETALLKKENMILYNQETKDIHGKQKKRKYFNLALKEIESASDERINYIGTTTTPELDSNNSELKTHLSDDIHDESTPIQTSLELSESKTSIMNQSKVSNEEIDKQEYQVPNEPAQNVNEQLSSSFEHTPVSRPIDLEDKNKPNDSDSYYTPEKKPSSSKKRTADELSTNFINLSSAESFESSNSKKLKVTHSFTKLSTYTNDDLECYFPIREVVLPLDFF